MTFIDQENLIQNVLRSNFRTKYPGFYAALLQEISAWQNERMPRNIDEFVLDVLIEHFEPILAEKKTP